MIASASAGPSKENPVTTQMTIISTHSTVNAPNGINSCYFFSNFNAASKYMTNAQVLPNVKEPAMSGRAMNTSLMIVGRRRTQ